MTMNLLAILLCGVAAMIIGFIWFGPLFGKVQMELMGAEQMSQEEKDAMTKAMWKMYALQFALALITAAIIDYIFLSWANGTSLFGIAFAVWLGFGVPIHASGALWSGKPKAWAIKRFALDVIPLLITYLAYAAILGLMI